MYILPISDPIMCNGVSGEGMESGEQLAKTPQRGLLFKCDIDFGFDVR